MKKIKGGGEGGEGEEGARGGGGQKAEEATQPKRISFRLCDCLIRDKSGKGKPQLAVSAWLPSSGCHRLQSAGSPLMSGCEGVEREGGTRLCGAVQLMACQVCSGNKGNKAGAKVPDGSFQGAESTGSFLRAAVQTCSLS